MTYFRCRRNHCDSLAAVRGGLCQFHLSPVDEDLHRPRTRTVAPDPYYGADAFSDDVAGMSSTEKYLHPEAE